MIQYADPQQPPWHAPPKFLGDSAVRKFARVGKQTIRCKGMEYLIVRRLPELGGWEVLPLTPVGLLRWPFHLLAVWVSFTIWAWIVRASTRRE